MKRATIAATIVIALLTGVAEGRASTITFGTVGSSSNAFPFGGVFSGAGTTYQQVYNAALFGASPIVITDITFFHTAGLATDTYDDGTYTFDLSTTSKAVNGLDTTFSNNLGPDNATFATVPLSGPMGLLTISGGPFLYDPSVGNLLLQIQNSSPTIGLVGFMDSMNETFGTDSSRTSDYGSTP